MRFPVFTKGRSALLRYKRNEEGTAIVLLGFAVFVLVGAAGLAFDAGRGYMLNARLSQAVDAAALAGGRSLSHSDDKAHEEIIRKYFKANLPDGYMGAEIPEPTIELLEGGDEIEVTVRATVPTTLMRVLGSESMQIAARAVVHRQVNGLEVALVLDHSGSMENDDKIVDLKSAVNNDLLPVLFGRTNNTVQNLYVSLVPFAGRTNLKGQFDVYPESPAPRDADYVCLDIRRDEFAENDAPPKKENFEHFSQGPYAPYSNLWRYRRKVCPEAAIIPLVQTRNTIEDAVTAMDPDDGCTRYDIGAVWGWRTLSPKWQGVWQDSASYLPLDYEEKDMQKAIVIMTDGRNTPACVRDVSTEVMSEDDQREASEAAFARICADMKANGIVVYTVTFRLDDEETNELFENCASGKDRYFRPSSGERLKADFTEIANDLSTLRLSQ